MNRSIRNHTLRSNITRTLTATGSLLICVLVFFMSFFCVAAPVLAGELSTPSARIEIGFYNGAAPTMAAADFNRDGKLDFAKASNGRTYEPSPCGMNIALGNGDGTFSPGVELIGGFGYRIASVIAPDLNADGKADVVFLSSHSNKKVYVYLGNGNGTFAEGRSYDVGGNSEHLAIADLDADGRRDDLIIANVFGRMQGMIGKSDGTFNPVRVSGPELGNYKFAASADFNSDGRGDVVVTQTPVYTNEYPTAHLWTGNGDGTFNDAGQIAEYWLAELTTADFNGDGRIDIAGITYYQPWKLTVMINNGNGTFTPRTGGVADYNGSIYSLKAADLNGDGRSDLVIGAEDEILTTLNNGDGTMQAPVKHDLQNEYYSRERVQGLVVRDFTGDNKPDVLYAPASVTTGNSTTHYSHVKIMRNIATATTATLTTNVPSNMTYEGEAVGFNVRVTADSTGSFGVPSGAATFKDNGTPLCSALINASGEGSCGTAQFPVGSHQITVEFHGDGGFTASNSNTITHTVIARPHHPTTTTLTSNVPSNTTLHGDAVGFTARVTSNNGTPVGSVTFKDNGTPLCAGPVNANGEATCGTAQFPVGTHQMTVEYHGYESFNPSTSNAITHTVNARPLIPTTTSITSNDPDNRTDLNAPVIFTARVVSNNGVPTGNVIFRNNGVAMCAKTLVNGAVNCGTTELTVGSHNMTVEYQGGAGFAASNSGILVHTVNPPAPVTSTLTPIADAYVRGASPDANFGATGELQVKRTLNAGSGKGRQAYLRFDTSSVAGAITSAKLRVFGRLNAANTNIPLGVFPVSNSTWTENGLTWNNKPAPNVPNTLAQVVVTDTTERWYELDITAFIQQERNAGRMVTGVLLRNMIAGVNGDYYTAINSRKAASNKPQLVIVQ